MLLRQWDSKLLKRNALAGRDDTRSVLRQCSTHPSDYELKIDTTYSYGRVLFGLMIQKVLPVKAESKITPVYGGTSVSIVRGIDFSSLVGRRVTEVSSACGTYGQGGPGFVGFKLEAGNGEPEEWLILCLWGGTCWLSVNGRWMGAHPDQYDIQRPLMSNFWGKTWDEFSPLVLGKTIKRFKIFKKSCTIDIGEARIVLSRDPTDRPPYPAGELRRLMPDDDLRQAWVLATAPWVRV